MRPRQDTRGIVDPAGMMARVDFRRHLPAPALRPFIEHYWLIDWDLEQPFEQQVVPHPSVNAVFGIYGDVRIGEIAGVGLDLFSIKLEGRGRVTAAQFRPGAFQPFSSKPLTNLRVPAEELFPSVEFDWEAPDRVAALDAYLLALAPAQIDPATARVIALVDQIRHDRSILRVAPFARRQGMTVRQLQRLFAERVGVSPKWVILRYRIHEALERALSDVDWAWLAAELGYSDQAHLVRDFTATVGLSPTAYRRLLQG
ncbi:helix-turn-helix domain-containing protein [Allorhizocola rhizosphaerae]|uniref:helix-turn-helix domain-containing protein n=1 Tax=Allorhizocola rhizosphaerae TaxID=1872709 RepID=UPI000E3E10E2|nr:helix-turn-helix domain-containing protein [Allorhizocola rhizosphaerae]